MLFIAVCLYYKHLSAENSAFFGHKKKSNVSRSRRFFLFRYISFILKRRIHRTFSNHIVLNEEEKKFC